MLIDFNQTIKDLAGNDILQKDEKGKDVKVTLKVLTINSLMLPKEGDSGEEKFKKYELAKRIFESDEPVDVPIEDITKLKGYIGKDYSPLVVGGAWNILEGK